MSDSSKASLFGVTLTELVIVLFFIMLLLAVFNIDKIRKEKEEIEDSYIALITDIDGSIKIPAETWKKWVEGLMGPIPEDETSDMVRIDGFTEKLEELLAASDSQPPDAPPDDGSGDCREGFWITPKCADHCWEIDSSESTRKYDYLVDIGVCKSSVVVQRSEWIENSESDFMLVNGALEMIDKKVMRASELYEYLDIIKQPGYIKEPKQCFYSVRLVDLGAGSIPRWQSIDKEISNKVNRLQLTSADKIYKQVSNRFPSDICDVSLEAERNINENKLIDQSDEEAILTIVNAKLNQDSFVNAFGIECSKSSMPINNKAIALDYQISLSNSGKVINVESLSNDSLINSGLKRLDSMAKRTLKKSKFTPKYLENVAVQSIKIEKISFGANACKY